MLQPPLDPLLRLILLDAIYFKGDWPAPFDTNLTRDLPFTLGNGQTVQHPRMSHTGHYGYCEEDRFRRWNFLTPGAAQHVCFPAQGRPGWISEKLHRGRLRGRCPADAFAQRHRGVAPFQTGKRIRSDRRPAHDGHALAFSARADFSGISDEPLHIGFVKQKTYVSVNEQGTEAAAVTAIGVGRMAVAREAPPFRFVVDRPFFMAIRERPTGLILFLGAISTRARKG